MDEKIERILNEIKRYLEERYGDKIKEVILYGSQARGDAREDSDVDVLVVVDDSIDVWDTLDYLGPLLGKFLTDGFVVTTIIVKENDWLNYPSEFFENVREEGIKI